MKVLFYHTKLHNPELATEADRLTNMHSKAGEQARDLLIRAANSLNLLKKPTSSGTGTVSGTSGGEMVPPPIPEAEVVQDLSGVLTGQGSASPAPRVPQKPGGKKKK